MIASPPMITAQSPPAAIARLARADSLIFRVSGSATIAASSSRSFQCLPRRSEARSNGNRSSVSTCAWLTVTPPGIGTSPSAAGSVGPIGSGSGIAAKSGTRNTGAPAARSWPFSPSRGAGGTPPTRARGASSRGDRGPSGAGGAGGAGSGSAGGACRRPRPAASAARRASCCSGVSAAQARWPASRSRARVSSVGRRPPAGVSERILVIGPSRVRCGQGRPGRRGEARPRHPRPGLPGSECSCAPDTTGPRRRGPGGVLLSAEVGLEAMNAGRSNGVARSG